MPCRRTRERSRDAGSVPARAERPVRPFRVRRGTDTCGIVRHGSAACEGPRPSSDRPSRSASLGRDGSSRPVVGGGLAAPVAAPGRRRRLPHASRGFGLWIETPPLWHAVGPRPLRAGAGGLALARAAGLAGPAARKPSTGSTATPACAHGPARALDDTLALGGDDAGTRALWDLHRRRAETAIERPCGSRRRGRACRGGTATRCAPPASWPLVGQRLRRRPGGRPPPRRRLRLAQRRRPPAPAFRVDGWIDPPLYTRTPPLMIDLAAASSTCARP